jgi:HK97 family phage prohead protease
MTVTERRYAATRFEMRGASEDSTGVIVGHASVFNSRSDFLYDFAGGFVEQVAPGFFDDALKTSDARALFNHDPNLILGRQSASTLRVAIDTVGLAYEIDPPDTTPGRDLVTSMKRGDVKESSFSFSVAEEKWGETEEGIPLRTLVRAGGLFDVSPVTFPAYPSADSGLRAALSGLAEMRSMTVDEAVQLARSGDLGRLITRRSLRPTEKQILSARALAHRPVSAA